MKNFVLSLLVGLVVLLDPSWSQAYQIYQAGKTSDTSVQVNTLGNPADSVKTYSYQLQDYAPAANATDVVCLSGAANKVVKLNRIQVTADATSSAVVDLYVYKRSAANTGGTATNPTPLKLDSADAAASATITLYSANAGALGTGSLLAGDHYMIPATTGNQYFFSFPWIEDFGTRNAKAVVLRSAAESVCVGMGGAALPAGFSLYSRFEWTEE